MKSYSAYRRIYSMMEGLEDAIASEFGHLAEYSVGDSLHLVQRVRVDIADLVFDALAEDIIILDGVE